MDEKKGLVTKGCRPPKKNPSKEEILRSLKERADEIHRMRNGKPGLYKISIMMSPELNLTEEDVNRLGFHARQMPTKEEMENAESTKSE